MAKSDAEQHILFCAQTFEENVGKILQQKINNIQTINQISNNQTNLTNSTNKQSKPNMTKLILSEFENVEMKNQFDNKILNNMSEHDVCFEILYLHEQRKKIKSSDKIKLTEIDKKIKKLESKIGSENVC
jgi:hypothetical protein